jgi:ascorbate-specific PTS system EIIC-type component UlaA
MIGSFFGAGHAAAVANKIAGRRAAIIAAFTEGIFNDFLGSFAYKVLLFGNVAESGATALYPSSSDAHVMAILVRLVGAVFGLGR